MLNDLQKYYLPWVFHMRMHIAQCRKLKKVYYVQEAAVQYFVVPSLLIIVYGVMFTEHEKYQTSDFPRFPCRKMPIVYTYKTRREYCTSMYFPCVVS